MRTSLAIATLIAAPVLLLAACSAPADPLKGTVQEIEHEPAVTKTQKRDIVTTVCTKPPGTTVNRCKDTKTGTAPVVITAKPECYELEIKLLDGSTKDICNEAAYRTLNVGDAYDSSIDYSTRETVR